MGSVVFFHAHPDDEAIFTGGTMALLAAAGVPVVLVTATRGECGVPLLTLDPGEAIADRREAETRAAAALLGCSDSTFLGWRDSGMAGDPANAHPRAFWTAPVELAAAALAEVCQRHDARALVTYDAGGIYGHPDHVQVHRVGEQAGRLAGVEAVYEATVDHEYLHFVDTHLVEGVAKPLTRAARSRLGLPTAEITTAIDVRPALERKRAAMAAHASQIPETDLGAPDGPFAAVYGWEWYVRRGPRSLLETTLA